MASQGGRAGRDLHLRMGGPCPDTRRNQLRQKAREHSLAPEVAQPWDWPCGRGRNMRRERKAKKMARTEQEKVALAESPVVWAASLP